MSKIDEVLKKCLDRHWKNNDIRNCKDYYNMIFDSVVMYGYDIEKLMRYNSLTFLEACTLRHYIRKSL